MKIKTKILTHQIDANQIKHPNIKSLSLKLKKKMKIKAIGNRTVELHFFREVLMSKFICGN